MSSCPRDEAGMHIVRECFAIFAEGSTVERPLKPRKINSLAALDQVASIICFTFTMSRPSLMLTSIPIPDFSAISMSDDRKCHKVYLPSKELWKYSQTQLARRTDSPSVNSRLSPPIFCESTNYCFPSSIVSADDLIECETHLQPIGRAHRAKDLNALSYSY